uniref:Uncharacterized protein n=1 Tax=Glossina austeni TaxID=7395 RepID=A0A1A9VU67_GLOAU
MPLKKLKTNITPEVKVLSSTIPAAVSDNQADMTDLNHPSPPASTTVILTARLEHYNPQTKANLLPFDEFRNREKALVSCMIEILLRESTPASKRYLLFKLQAL